MPYEAVLHLIDAEIARLDAARRILLSEPDTVGRQPRRSAIALSAAAAEPRPGEPEAVLMAAPNADSVPSAVTVNRVPARRRRADGAARRGPRARQPQEPGALSGQIPATPVAVSAADAVRSRQALVREAAAKGEPEIQAGEGTLESLLKDLQARSNAAA